MELPMNLPLVLHGSKLKTFLYIPFFLIYGTGYRSILPVLPKVKKWLYKGIFAVI